MEKKKTANKGEKSKPANKAKAPAKTESKKVELKVLNNMECIKSFSRMKKGEMYPNIGAHNAQLFIDKGIAKLVD